MKRRTLSRVVVFLPLLTILCDAWAGDIYQTRGIAVIMASGALTIKIEKKDIPIPSAIELGSTPGFADLQPDSTKGWTKCRVPLKGEMSWQGPIRREMVFDCQRLR